MSRTRTRRRGRTRMIDARRQPNGDVYTPTTAREIVPAGALDRRAELLAMDRSNVAALMRVDGSSNIGIVFARGLILPHHRDAALALAMTYQAWRQAAEIPKRHSKSATLFGQAISDPTDADDGCRARDVTDADLIRAEVRYEQAMAVIPRGLKMELVTAVAIDSDSILQTAPRLFADTAIGRRLASELCAALDILAGHYGILAESEAA